jgi:septal ring factor EnvC (AmiA/AmiB activator)
MMRWGLVCIIAVCSACGTLSQTVDRDLLREVSIENKLVLFDSENEVSIAMDERDKIQRTIRDAKLDIRDAQRQIREAYSDQERAEEKGDEKAFGIAYLAEEVFELKIDYLEFLVDYHRERLSAQEDVIVAARARHELHKAKLVVRSNVRGASDIDLEDFEGQVADKVESAKASQSDLTEVEQELNAVKAVWLERRKALMAASGGGLGSAWAEDSALWQEGD